MLTLEATEHGGQVLRTALALSAVTGTPVTVERFRAKRPKPGLLRRHLACVKAAAAVTGAEVRGAEIGARTLSFEPGPIRGGDHAFALGALGSTPQVLLTVLPMLLAAGSPSRLAFTGVTHAPGAPTLDWLQRVLVPLLARMGAHIEITPKQAGFAGSAGGAWQARIEPATLQPITIEEAGAVLARRVTADVANIPYDVAAREAAKAAAEMSWPPETAVARTVRADGPGNVVAIEIVCEHVTAMFTGFGARSTAAEAVADETVREARAWLASRAPVSAPLAEVLLVPLSIAGRGAFVTSPPTPRLRATGAVVEKLLPVDVDLDELDGDRWRVSVSS